ncbi:MAG: SurA N-terminal domain-containing protein [Verrucomicrobiae bacterium]|nr:SurA N-terminal domain-containing protein [Verrucomicrobiae bacterium]
MIGTLRKHSQALWYFIIVIIVISFVYFFTPEVDQLGASASADFGSFQGEKLKRQDWLDASSQARVSFFLQTGRWPTGAGMEQRMDMITRQRLMINKLAAKAGILVSDDAVSTYIVRNFSDPQTGAFSKTQYDGFLQNIASTGGVQEEQFIEFVRSDLALQTLSRLHGQSGQFVSTRAADGLFRRENEQLEAEAVFISTSNYVSRVSITTNAISTYFTNRLASYRIPERVVVNYVYFAFTNFNDKAEAALATETNLTARIETEYTNRGTNAFRDAEGKMLSAEDAKKKIRAEFIETKASELGQKVAFDFANEVFAIAEVKSENLLTVAKKHGYGVKETKPFTELDGPEDMDVPGNFASTAFNLSTEEPLASPLNWINGIYLIAYNRRVASESPALSNVWDKVVADYKSSQALELAVQAGTKLAASVNQGLAAGLSFSSILETNGFKSVEIPAFSRNTRSIPQVEDFGVSPSEVIGAAFNLEVGHASTFRRSGRGGYIVMTKKLIPVDEAKLKEDLPEFLNDVRSERMNLAFQEWFSAEFAQSGLAPAQPAPAEQ